MAAEVAVERSGPDQVRITVQEGMGGVIAFVLFVAGIAGALYVLVPEARERPGWLFGLVAVGMGWGTLASWFREEYTVDRRTRTVRALHTGLLGKREREVRAPEVSHVRLALSGPDDDRRIVELLGPRRELRLRIPRRADTLSTADQSAIGRPVAEHLGVPLQGGSR